MKFPIISLSFLSLVTLCGLISVAEETAEKALQSGKYNLRLIVPAMAEGKRDVTLPATVTIKDEEVLIETQGMMGNSIKLSGYIRKGITKFGLTETERESIISMHFIGTVVSETLAKGRLTFFGDDAKLFDGKWELTIRGKKEGRKEKKGER